MNLRRKLTWIGWLWIVWAFVLACYTLPHYFGAAVDQYGPGGWLATAGTLLLEIAGVLLCCNREPGSARILAWIGWKLHRRKRC